MARMADNTAKGVKDSNSLFVFGLLTNTEDVKEFNDTDPPKSHHLLPHKNNMLTVIDF